MFFRLIILQIRTSTFLLEMHCFAIEFSTAGVFTDFILGQYYAYTVSIDQVYSEVSIIVMKV